MKHSYKILCGVLACTLMLLQGCASSEEEKESKQVSPITQVGENIDTSAILASYYDGKDYYEAYLLEKDFDILTSWYENLDFEHYAKDHPLSTKLDLDPSLKDHHTIASYYFLNDAKPVVLNYSTTSKSWYMVNPNTNHSCMIDQKDLSPLISKIFHAPKENDSFFKKKQDTSMIPANQSVLAITNCFDVNKKTSINLPSIKKPMYLMKYFNQDKPVEIKGFDVSMKNNILVSTSIQDVYYGPLFFLDDAKKIDALSFDQAPFTLYAYDHDRLPDLSLNQEILVTTSYVAKIDGIQNAQSVNYVANGPMYRIYLVDASNQVTTLVDHHNLDVNFHTSALEANTVPIPDASNLKYIIVSCLGPSFVQFHIH